MEADFLVKIVLPIALFIIMLGMGLSLVPYDFKRILKQPKAFFIGITCQLILLPILALIIIKIFNPSPILSIGLLILSFCPGGTTSNLFAYLAKADLALSVSLTAVVSIITPFTIPLFTQMSFTHFLGSTHNFDIPILKTIIQLTAITVLPIGIGMLINIKAPNFSSKCEKPIKIFSTFFLFIIIAGILKNNWSNMDSFLRQIGAATLTLNILALLLGFFIAKISNLSQKQSATIGLEIGIQNGTTALLVTGTILSNAEMSIPPTIYSLFMFGTGAIFAILINREKASPNKKQKGLKTIKA